MATVVPTSEEDPALSVVRYTAELSWGDAGPEVAEGQVSRLLAEAGECMIQNRWLDLASLMLTSADVIFSKASDKDLECIYIVVCNLVKKPESLDQVHEMAELIATKFTQQPNNKPTLRLKILFNLYNLLENPYSRFFVYMKALNLAVSGNATEHVVPSFKKMDSFLREWNLGVKDQRNLFLTVTNILKETKSSAKDSFKFLIKYLATFSGEDASTLNEAKEEAVRAIIEFLKAPDMFQSDLHDMPVVAQLENDPKYSLVYQLLKIFVTQRLDAYLDFHAKNPTFLTSYGLVHEDCVTKMRLLSLVDLSTNESGRAPYSLIKETLKIEGNEVELWVVKAITAKLMDCRIDQMNQVVIVSRYTERDFGHQQWQALRSKLGAWRGHISNVITTIQANKITEDGTQAMQGLAIR
ncbi:eukaryotic translation initiation factor 3 subunit M [Dorcoceras hygrometricum]|uniref:Eukaryotic translation initiation factor 3 subunit M n=1 Tax=Dorcoceras hygrometricum TaxID=472368 RepID=A0A2Z7CIF1_9LAMI|nr:eukaryotic translation initiation factor 3 subunit M [Dorcoceras hygrometricum]